ncbi:hypothetical protein Ancab_029488 [Ancistrocladus abbreviatus]
MPKHLQKYLSEYLSKIKKQTPHLHISPSSLSSAASKIFSGCKHPKSLSFSVDRNRRHNHHEETASNHNDHQHQNDDGTAATLADIDRFLCENFKSLYGNNNNGSSDSDSDNDDGVKQKAGASREKDHNRPATILFDSPSFFNAPPDLCGSHRFFFSSGGSSPSLMDDVQTSGADSTTTTTSEAAMNHAVDGCGCIGVKEVMPTGGGQDCIAVLTASPNAYEEFRRSMKEMIEARLRQNQSVDWDFVEELLFCYLRLNEKKQYKYILGAFVDLIMILRQNSGSSSRGVTKGGGSRNIEEREKGKDFK